METFLSVAVLLVAALAMRQLAYAKQPQRPRSIVGGVFFGMWLFVISVILLPLFLIALVGGALVK